MNIKKYWAEISLLFCIFFVVSPMTITENPWLIALDIVIAIYWANEFVVSIKKPTE